MRAQLGIVVTAVIAAASLGLCRAADAPAATEFTHRTADGITFTVTTQGLSTIRVKNRDVATGGWRLFNAEPWFKDGGAGAVQVNKAPPGSLEIVDKQHVRVWLDQGDCIITTDYRFDGEDVLISSRVENNHASEPLNIAGFGGLQFIFERQPTGLMPVQHISYFKAHGTGLCHPSHWAKIGGSYAVDDSFGVGVSPWNTGWTRTLTLWDYPDWRLEARENLPRRNLLYFVVAPVPPGGARMYKMKLRVSTNCTWQHLLEPYKEHFAKTFGPARYKPDYRWVASDYMNHSQQAVSPTNPYGYHGGTRRIDTAEGVKQFCDQTIKGLKDGNGQGVILWGQGGDDPRGAMYRPDFDILPPETEANWPALTARFKEANLKLGVCTRPSDMAVRRDWKSDQVIQINADDPGHRAMLVRRFRTMMDHGCTLFYLDSFGADLDHVKLMRHLRETLGPDVLTFAEHQCDAIFPFSGGYSETTFSQAKEGKEAGYNIWSGTQNWEIYRWLVPEAQIICRLYQVDGKVPADFEPVERYFFRHRLTPLAPCGEFDRRVPRLAEIQPEFVGSGGHWK